MPEDIENRSAISTGFASSKPNSELELVAVACPLCGSDQFRRRLELRDYFYGVPGIFQLVRCQACGHVYLNPRPTLPSIGLCYPPAYAQYQDVPLPPESPTGPWYTRPPISRIPGLRRFYRWLTADRGFYFPDCPQPDRRALEIGCGTGNFLVKLQAAGWLAMGLEPSRDAAALAAAKGFDVRPATFEEVQLPEHSLDAVFAWMVWEHLPDPVSATQRVSSLLKSGGSFCFSVPNWTSWEARACGRYWQGYDAPRHLQHFQPQMLRQMLLRCGFDEVRILHQRNVRSLLGALAARRLQRNPDSRTGRTLMRWFDDGPPRWLRLLLWPMAFFLATIRRAGRITIVARKALSEP